MRVKNFFYHSFNIFMGLVAVRVCIWYLSDWGYKDSMLRSPEPIDVVAWYMVSALLLVSLYGLYKAVKSAFSG